jgi:hypothetical protein
MPKAGADRDDFVARVQRRRRWAHLRLSLQRLVVPDKRPLQEALYGATFRSDAEAVNYHYARRNDHLPDLDHPVWLDEKIRWQFLNHPNPLMSYAADKIAARKYLQFMGAQIAAPMLIATGSSPEELADAELPESFALKSNFGSGQNHIEKPGMHTPREELIAKVSHWMSYDQWRQTGEFHYRSVEKGWLVEEYLSAQEKMYEYKVYCFMGEPVFLSVITERNVDGKAGLEGIWCAVFDINWRRLAFGWQGVKDDPRDVPRPPAFDLLIEEARRLSRCFMHVRVDFLCCDGHFTFSELTFASMAARVPLVPLSFNEQFGQMMDLERAPEYLELGQSVMALLNEQERSTAPLGRTTIDSLLSPSDPGASDEFVRNLPRSYGNVGLELDRSA